MRKKLFIEQIFENCYNEANYIREVIFEMGLIYFLIALTATLLGSAVGLGGGVIIKPMLDFLGHYNIETINTLSSTTVFAMSISSLIRQFRAKAKINFKIAVPLAIGSVIGGVLGQNLLSEIVKFYDVATVSLFQSVMLAVLLSLVIYYMNNKQKFPAFNVTTPVVSFLVGLVLGTLAAFLGIGGGPINVAVLTMFFGMTAKQCAINSIIVILFSQGSKLLTITLTTGFSPFDLSMLIYMIPAGIMGGIIGAQITNKATNEQLVKLFNAVTFGVVVLNVWNAYSAIF